MPPTEIDYTLEVITPPPAIPMPKVEYELVTTSLPEHCF
jgi:hypothetical protein